MADETGNSVHGMHWDNPIFELNNSTTQYFNDKHNKAENNDGLVATCDYNRDFPPLKCSEVGHYCCGCDVNEFKNDARRWSVHPQWPFSLVSHLIILFLYSSNLHFSFASKVEKYPILFIANHSLNCSFVSNSSLNIVNWSLIYVIGSCVVRFPNRRRQNCSVYTDKLSRNIEHCLRNRLNTKIPHLFL